MSAVVNRAIQRKVVAVLCVVLHHITSCCHQTVRLSPLIWHMDQPTTVTCNQFKLIKSHLQLQFFETCGNGCHIDQFIEDFSHTNDTIKGPTLHQMSNSMECCHSKKHYLALCLPSPCSFFWLWLSSLDQEMFQGKCHLGSFFLAGYQC